MSVTAPYTVVASPPAVYVPVDPYDPVMSEVGTTLPSALTRTIVLLSAAAMEAPTAYGRHTMASDWVSNARVIRPVSTVELDSVHPDETSVGLPLTLDTTAPPVGKAIV